MTANMVYKIKVLGWEMPMTAKRQHLFITQYDAPFEEQAIISCCKKWQESAWGVAYNQVPQTGARCCKICQDASLELAQPMQAKTDQDSAENGTKGEV